MLKNTVISKELNYILKEKYKYNDINLLFLLYFYNLYNNIINIINYNLININIKFFIINYNFKKLKLINLLDIYILFLYKYIYYIKFNIYYNINNLLYYNIKNKINIYKIKLFDYIINKNNNYLIIYYNNNIYNFINTVNNNLLYLNIINFYKYIYNIILFKNFIKNIKIFNFKLIIKNFYLFIKLKIINIYIYNLFINYILLNKINIISLINFNYLNKINIINKIYNIIFKKIYFKKLKKINIYKILKLKIINIELYNNIYINKNIIINIINKYNNNYLFFIKNLINTIKLNNNINYINKYILIKQNKIIKNNIYINSIIGQNIILNKIKEIIKKSFKIKNKINKPNSSWLFCGVSGSGKTETIKLLNKQYFNNKKNLIRLDMSEYMEKHSISKLIGSPPGYIGYEQGGYLVNLVNKTKKGFILFDEIEKSHKDILNLMLQILEEACLTDSKNNKAMFNDFFIVLTSNLGWPKSPYIFKSYLNNKSINKIEFNKLKNTILKNIREYFKPEFLNRLNNIFIFKPLTINNLFYITNKFINQFIYKLKFLKFNIILNINNNIKLLISKLSYNPILGARPVKYYLNIFIELPIINIIYKLNITKFILIDIFLDKKINKIIYNIKI